MSIRIVGYEAGNLGSVLRAFARVGVAARVVRQPEEIDGASHVLLPGVGGFAAAMEVLRREGWDEALRRHARAGRPLLGICLGMQLLGTSGDEGGECVGLDLIPGPVVPLAALGCGPTIPHLGWNDVRLLRRHSLLNGIEDGTDFYFAHSYALSPTDSTHVLGLVEHGATFAGIVAAGSVSGIQWHPEKSSAAGLRILQNFAGSPRC